MWTSQLFNFSLSSQRQRLTLQTAVQLSLLLTPKCHGLLAGSLASQHTTLHYSTLHYYFKNILKISLSPLHDLQAIYTTKNMLVTREKCNTCIYTTNHSSYKTTTNNLVQ